MASIPIKVTKRGPGLPVLMDRIKQVKRSDVLVGIPAAETLRKGEPINNASLMFIQTHGSDLQGIPARPVLEPSIEKNKNLIAPQLATAAKQVLSNHPEQAQAALLRAGMVAANGAKRYFTDPDNGWAPNAPSTIAKKGSDKPLIDTGQLRRAITAVVREDQHPVVHGSFGEGVKDLLEEAAEKIGEVFAETV